MESDEQATKKLTKVTGDFIKKILDQPGDTNPKKGGD